MSLKLKQQPPQAKQAKGVGVIKAVSPSVPLVTLGRPEEPDECFKPFIFDGFVSLTGLVEDQRPVKILRDTASSQTKENPEQLTKPTRQIYYGHLSSYCRTISFPVSLFLTIITHVDIKLSPSQPFGPTKPVV